MQLVRNSFYSLVGVLIPIVITLISVPLLVNLAGQARYGVLAIAWIFLAYFALFDLGVGRATVIRIASVTKSSEGSKETIFGTALTLGFISGLIGGFVLWISAYYYFVQVMQLENALRSEIEVSVRWMILGVPVSTMLSVFNGVLHGEERFLELSVAGILSAAAFQLAPLAAAFYGQANLAVMIPITVICNLACMLIVGVAACRVLGLELRRLSFSLAEARRLLGFGGWFTVSSVIGPLMIMTDRFLIGASLSAKAVTQYTIPFHLAEKTSVLATVISNVLLPRFALIGESRRQELAVKGSRALAGLVTLAFSIALVFLEPFLTVWISREFSTEASLAGQVLLVGWWINCFARIPMVLLHASDRAQLVARCHLLEFIPYLVLLFFAVNYLGLVGAALVFFLRNLVDFLLLAKLSGMLFDLLRLLYVPTVFIAISVYVAMRLDPGSHVWLFAMVVSLSIAFFWAWRQVADSLLDSARNYLRSRGT